MGVQRVTETQNNVVITDRMWARLLSSTNQPSFLRCKATLEDKMEEETNQVLDGEKCMNDDNKVVSENISEGTGA